jgi:hypothetical protein
MKLETGEFCPLVQGDCKKTECAWFGNIRGLNPNTGEEVDDWNCAIVMLPMLLIENSQQSRQTGAAVESFRNEMVKTNNASVELLASMASTPRLNGSGGN